MIVFGLFVVALAVIGTHFTALLWKRLDPEGAADTPPAELLNAGLLAGVAAWIAINWLLALTHTLNAIALWTCVAIVVTAAIPLAVRHLRILNGREIPRETAIVLSFLVPLFLWLIYILWRGIVLPPASHDALSYHLPKAVLLDLAHGWELFRASDYRIHLYPFNYELLLADILILAKGDAFTEWIGTLSYLLVLVGAAAFTQRWWRGSLIATLAAVIATASAPLFLLHSGADKNDLLTTWFSLCALLWGARWAVRGGRMPMLLVTLALGLGFGTKTLIAAVGLALAPFLIRRWISAMRAGTLGARDLLLTASVALMTFVLGGGVPIAANYFALPVVAQASTTQSLTGIEYGDWSNLWQVPYLMLTIPFSPSPAGVWVPWRGELWFWPHYEIFFSHLGKLFTILVLSLPLVVWRYRARAAEVVRPERTIATTAAVLAIAIMLPTQMRPLGFFGAFARYFAFIVPIVVAWVVPPVIDAAHATSRRIAYALMAILALVFTVEAARCAVKDRFAPLEYAVWASNHPGTRFIWFSSFRAGSIVDRYAGPADTVAVDGSFDTWVYPAYGRDLTRRVVFLPSNATPSDIPAEVQWVMIDRSWNAVWGNPNLTNMGQRMRYIGQGTPTPDDVRLLLALSKDPRFRLVYFSKKSNQAVFRRVAP